MNSAGKRHLRGDAPQKPTDERLQEGKEAKRRNGDNASQAHGSASLKIQGKTTSARETKQKNSVNKRKRSAPVGISDTTSIDQHSDAGKAQFWLMKAEPESRIEKGVDVRFSIDDLAACTQPEGWDGVRNPVARNNMRAMRKGDLAFFYHSNCKSPGVVGIMEIVQEHSPDTSANDPQHPYFDPKDDPKKSKWSLVHVEFRRKFDHQVSLKEMQKHAHAGGELENLQTLRLSRLSVSKVSQAEWNYIISLADVQV